MTVQITIIGTGKIGASIGLALGAYKDMFVRVGHDIDNKVANRAKAMGALDKVSINLPSAVADAQIVVLALPLDQIKDTLKIIASDLKDEAVVMDTAPVKGEVLQWAEELIPTRRYYIGLTPALNPAYLDTPGLGVEAAHEDLFKNGIIAILPSPAAPSEAIKLASDFCHLLGAGHLFIDLVELDSMMAATYVLPQFIAAALVKTTIDQPGWQEARKLAGGPYANATSSVVQFGEASSLAEQALSAQDHLLRWIDVLMDNLSSLRQQLANKDAESLVEELKRAKTGREKWLKEKLVGDWAAVDNTSNVELPTVKDIFARMFTFGGRRKPKEPK